MFCGHSDLLCGLCKVIRSVFMANGIHFFLIQKNLLNIARKLTVEFMTFLYTMHVRYDKKNRVSNIFQRSHPIAIIHNCNEPIFKIDCLQKSYTITIEHDGSLWECDFCIISLIKPMGHTSREIETAYKNCHDENNFIAGKYTRKCVFNFYQK